MEEYSESVPNRIRLSIVCLAFLLVSGCHSYNTVLTSDLEAYLSSNDVEVFQVVDSSCTEYSGDTWSLSEEGASFDGRSIPLEELELVRTRSKLKRPLTIGTFAGLPTGVLLGAMARLEGAASIAGSFAFGFLPVALPAFLILRSQNYHVVTWVRHESEATRVTDKSQFPCRD